MEVKGTHMNEFTINGVGTINGGEFGALKINGIGKCTGDLKAVSYTHLDVYKRQMHSLTTHI